MPNASESDLRSLCSRPPDYSVARARRRGFYGPEERFASMPWATHEANMIKSSPQKILAQGTDWRFVNELKKELRASPEAAGPSAGRQNPIQPR